MISLNTFKWNTTIFNNIKEVKVRKQKLPLGGYTN